MYVLTIANRKGGVGKTALSQAIGAGFARDGKKVLLIDFDNQASLTYSCGCEPGGEAFAFAAGRPPKWQEVKGRGFSYALMSAYYFPTPEELAVFRAPGGAAKVAHRIRTLITGFDYVIIDTPPGVSEIMLSALIAADGVTVPVTADGLALQGLRQIEPLIEAAKHHHPVRLLGAVLTQHSPRSILARQMSEQIAKECDRMHTRMFKSVLRSRIAWREAQAMGQDIYTYAPGSDAANDADWLLDELRGAISEPESI